MISIFPKNRSSDNTWVKIVLDRCVELMGPAGAHPYYDLLCVEFVELGIEPDRGSWRSKLTSYQHIDNMLLELQIDDPSFCTWLKLELDDTEINGTLLKVIS